MFVIKDSIEGRMYAERGDEIIKIETKQNITRSQFEEYSTNQSALLLGIFESQLPPYPEFLTKQTWCEEKFIPREQQTGLGKFFTLYAGTRQGYGVCVDDLVQYRASVGLFYCDKTSIMFKVEYFINKKESADTLISFNKEITCLL